MTSQPILAGAHQVDAASRRRRAILADVIEGLSRTPRELPSKYFYDEHGSRLFEEITRLPEYYLTRAEREILETRSHDIIAATAPSTLIELGAGSANKTRLLLGAMHDRCSQVTYVPVDVSEEFLEQTSVALQREMNWLTVDPVVSDLTVSLDLPRALPGPVLFAFLGSTIGNFDGTSAVALLRRVRAQMRPGDHFLIGTDLRKDRDVLEAAYNDSAGVTAQFNRNILRVINAELGADFAPERFEHQAFYDDATHRIEMHLRSSVAQTVHAPGMPAVDFLKGESIRTELSHKYDRAAVDTFAAAARLRVTAWFTDAAGQFALSILEVGA